MLCTSSFEGLPYRSKNPGEASKLLWQYCGCHDMVALNLLRAGEFDTPYEYCREEVAYVRHFHALIRTCEDKNLYDVERVRSLCWVFFDRTLHSLHLPRRQEMFEHGNNFCQHVRSKGVAFVAWPDFSLCFRMPDAVRHAHWLAPSMIVHNCYAAKFCIAVSSPAAEYMSERARTMLERAFGSL